jgi:hypothetical protein
VQGDLLRGDRSHERLERIRGNGRAQALKRVDDLCEHRVGRGERVERVELELRAEQLADDRARLVVQQFDVDAAGSSSDADLAPAHGPPQRSVLPHVRGVAAPRAVARRRKLEVVRLGEAQQTHDSRG